MSSTSPGSDYVGSVIDGRFPLLAGLGETERSRVFLTELGGGGQKAAIKLIPAAGEDVEAVIAQWETARTLSHPSLVRLFDFGRCQVEGESLLYVVTEHAEEFLADVLSERALTPEETEEMLDPVLAALSYLHDRNLVHGHLKPSNIMVVSEHLKLSVDRVCSASEARSPSTSGDAGEPPEAATGKLSPAADLWALGAVVVEALTQKPPVWDRARGGDPTVPASVPRPFSDIARNCLRVSPTSRCTVSDVRALLTAAHAAEPTAAAPAVAQPAPAAQAVAKPAVAEPESESDQTAPRRSPVLILAGVLLVAGAALAVYEVTSHRNRSSTSPEAQETTSAPAVPEAPGPASESQPPNGPAAKAVVIHQAMPDAPQQALDTIRGHVSTSILVHVDAEGNVSDAAVDSPGPSRYFANLALSAARNWKFRPAQAGGRAVTSTWTLQFRFEPSGTSATSTQTSP